MLRAAGLTEADIAAGLYDAARVEAWVVDWRNPAARHLLDVFEIGEIRRGPEGFVAELRGLAHRFDEERGRIYSARCDADFGDARCGAAATPHQGAVSWSDGRMGVRLAGLGWAASGTFTGGRLTFLSGANAGFQVEARDHASVGSEAALTLWIEAPRPIAAGDLAQVTPGCDKSFATCRDRFGNAINFRGFPHIPGNDFLLQTAGEGLSQRFDGGSLFR